MTVHVRSALNRDVYFFKELYPIQGSSYQPILTHFTHIISELSLRLLTVELSDICYNYFAFELPLRLAATAGGCLRFQLHWFQLH